MGFDLRMPNITGATEREMLSQIRSYLYQFIPQLQWALNNLEVSTKTSQATPQIITGKATSNAPVDAETSFNAIKALIIKSADIVEAYYEEINYKLVSEYKALSDFGTYAEQTEKLVRDTAAFTETTYSRFATIEDSLGVIQEIDNRAYIKTGILVESMLKEEAEKYGKKEGDALIGIEVGDSDSGTFRKYARFTSNRLSFYDQNDNEVAYISNFKLFIKTAEILIEFKRGGYVDTISPDGGIVTKWVGGNG
jgi:hypothetical protein